MKISQLAQRTGIPASAIRYYESIGLLPAKYVQRSGNNYREYSEDTIEFFIIFRKLQKAGLRLDELKAMISHEHPHTAIITEKMISMLEVRLEDVKEAIAELYEVKAYIEELIEYKKKLVETQDSIDYTIPQGR
jgi:DNA-binding transcriptional MerR regulator